MCCRADKVIININKGVYEEDLVIRKYKHNIILCGEGRDNTIISGDRSMVGIHTDLRLLIKYTVINFTCMHTHDLSH